MKDVQVKGIVEELINKMINVLQISIADGLVQRTIKEAYNEGLEKAEIQFDMNFVPDPERLKLLTTHTYDNIKGMNDEIAEKLRAEMQRGLLNFESVDSLKKRVKKVMDIGIERARMIARTEYTRAANAGSLDAAKQSGLDLKKKWIAAPGERTCPECGSQHGTIIPIDSLFVYGDKSYVQPPAHPNCRCSLVYVEKGMEDV